jgi:hypothetical protein
MCYLLFLHLLGDSKLLNKVLEEGEGNKTTSKLRNNIEEELIKGKNIVQVHHEGNSGVEMTTRDRTTEENNSGKGNNNGDSLTLAEDNTEENESAEELNKILNHSTIS